MGDINRDVVILYPAGGAFNKLRPQQIFLECLLEDSWEGYSLAPPNSKKDYVRDHILARIGASGRVLKIFRGKNPDKGRLFEPSDDEAFDRIAQKLRDMKKRRARPAVRTAAAAARAKKKTRMSEKAAEQVSAQPKTASFDNDEDGDSDDDDYDYEDEDSGDGGGPSQQQDEATKESVRELKEVIWGQWEQIDSWRRLCSSQKETVQTQMLVISHQHQLLVSLGIVNNNSKS